MKNEGFLTKVSHRAFSKMLSSVREKLDYSVIKPFVIREPEDSASSIIFYHPLWKKMPVAKIQETWTEKGIVKEYYINEPFINVLKEEERKE